MELQPIKEVLNVGVNVAKFIGERLLGGGWSDLPKPGEQPAAIYYFPEREEPDDIVA